MLKRRSFLKKTGAAALGSFVIPKQIIAAFLNSPHPIGLQLYTLFNVMDKDVKENLQKVADIGYKELESAFSKTGPFYGMEPKEFASLVISLGMSWKSHHVLGAPFKLRPGAKLPTSPDGKPITMPPMKNLKE